MAVSGFIFLEKTTPVITGYFVDDNGAAISIEELKVTIYDSLTKEIINSKDNLAVTISNYVNATTGYLEYPLTVNDMTIIRRNSQPGDIVEHIVRFDYKWESLSKANSTAITMKIKNLDHK